VPSQHDLRRRPRVAFGQLDDRWLLQEVVARAERGPALGTMPCSAW
jgi:hypothetical protein